MSFICEREQQWNFPSSVAKRWSFHGMPISYVRVPASNSRQCLMERRSYTVEVNTSSRKSAASFCHGKLLVPSASSFSRRVRKRAMSRSLFASPHGGMTGVFSPTQWWKYCLEFARDWLHHSPHAEKFRIEGGVCYSEEDFIAYLNQYVFPEERSVPVKNLGRMNLGEDLPEEYRGCPCFHF